MMRLNGHAIGDFLDEHSRLLGEEFSEHAVMGGVEMLDDDESHSSICGNMTEEFRNGFDSACRSADGCN